MEKIQSVWTDAPGGIFTKELAEGLQQILDEHKIILLDKKVNELGTNPDSLYQTYLDLGSKPDNHGISPQALYRLHHDLGSSYEGTNNILSNNALMIGIANGLDIFEAGVVYQQTIDYLIGASKAEKIQFGDSWTKIIRNVYMDKLNEYLASDKPAESIIPFESAVNQ